MLPIFFTAVLKYWGNLQAVLETLLKTSARGYWAGLNKRKLKVLFYECKSFIHSACLQFGTVAIIKFLAVRNLGKFVMNIVFSRKA